MKPNFEQEKELRKNGFRFVAGIDEAGRGSLAGPVSAAAVIVKIPNFKPSFSLMRGLANGRRKRNLEVKDSKQLSPEQREKLYLFLTKHPLIEWGFGIISPAKIDEVNILEATKLAMEKAVKSLDSKIKKRCPKGDNKKTKKGNAKNVFNRTKNVDFLILDGKIKLKLALPQKSIIKADQKVFSCSAASIIAKVKRDRIMKKYHKKYPLYGFNRHCGYPTKFHQRALKKYGACQIHRKTFGPVSRVIARI